MAQTAKLAARVHAADEPGRARQRRGRRALASLFRRATRSDDQEAAYELALALTRSVGLRPEADELLARLTDLPAAKRGAGLAGGLLRAWVETRTEYLAHLIRALGTAPRPGDPGALIYLLKFGGGGTPTNDVEAGTYYNLLADTDPEVRGRAAAGLSSATAPSALEVVAKHWEVSRWEFDAYILVERRFRPNTPSQVMVRALWQDPTLADVHSDQVAALVAASRDPDDRIASCATAALRNLTHQGAQSALLRHALAGDADALNACAAARYQPDTALLDEFLNAWAATREERLATILAHAEEAPRPNHPHAVLHRVKFGDGGPPRSAAEVEIYRRLLEDDDASVRLRAADGLRASTAHDVLEAIADQWVSDRASLDAEILTERTFRPADEGVKGVLVRLLWRDPALWDTPPKGLEALMNAGHDADPAIVSAAREILLSLTNRESQEWLCEQALTGDVAAVELCIAARYVPGEDHERALFLFLTEQWDRYEDFDFDSRLLAGAYAAIGDGSRARIRELAARSGRSSVLRVVLGGDRSTRVATLTRDEAEFLVAQLIAARDFDEVWRLLLEFPLEWALSAVRSLDRLRWRPSRSDDMALFTQLSGTTDVDMGRSLVNLREIVPIAAQQARVHFDGRVNSVAFSPRGPFMAIASNRRRVGLWNLQDARLEWVNESFERSVGHVVVLEDGSVVATERTNATYNQCAMRSVQDRHRAEVLDVTQGSYTGLVALPDGVVVVAGRDHRVRAIDVASRQLLFEHVLADWPRSMQLGDRSRLIVTHDGVAVIDASTRALVLDQPSVDRYVPVDAVLGPGSNDLILGFRTAPPTVFTLANAVLRPTAVLMHRSLGVRALATVPSRQLVFVGHTFGATVAYTWPGRNVAGELHPDSAVTSLSVSPNGDFLAIGHPDDTATLWDLRVSEVPALFSQPLSAARPSSLALLGALSTAKLPKDARRLLDALIAMLRYRFRHDIEIDGLVQIRQGRHDILIDQGA